MLPIPDDYDHHSMNRGAGQRYSSEIDPNSIGDDGAMMIANALHTNNSLVFRKLFCFLFHISEERME